MKRMNRRLLALWIGMGLYSAALTGCSAEGADTAEVSQTAQESEAVAEGIEQETAACTQGMGRNTDHWREDEMQS